MANQNLTREALFEKLTKEGRAVITGPVTDLSIKYWVIERDPKQPKEYRMGFVSIPLADKGKKIEIETLIPINNRAIDGIVAALFDLVIPKYVIVDESNL